MRSRTVCVLLISAGLAACSTRPELVAAPCPTPPAPPPELMAPPASSDYLAPFDSLMRSIEQLEQWLTPSTTPSAPASN